MAPPLTCPQCGSQRLHRSHPRNRIESLLRATTPLRFHRCSECGVRGRHWAWSVPEARRPGVPAPPGLRGRRQERRDELAARARRKRLVLSVAIATLLGVLASVFAAAR